MGYASDYVVVGAGSAGCVIARRLCESGASVTLLEAGGSDRSLRFRAPALYPLIQDSDADWCYRTTPQTELNDRIIPWPRGKVLGGSSSINAMIYIRGHRSNYDDWAASGCTGWSWAEVQPLFRRLEARFAAEPESHYGTTGLVQVENLATPMASCVAFVEAAARALDVPAGHDFNGPRQRGASLFVRSCRNVRRESASTAYLRSCDAERLLVVSGVLAKRVVVEGGRAVGVEVVRGGHVELFRADCEVIVSGGAIGSPHLLMLSGIGPADELRSHGIDVVADLSVGRNLQDHVIAPASWQCLNPKAVMQLGPLTVVGRVLAWFLGMRSALATNHAEAGAFFSTDASIDVPNMQFHMAPWGNVPPNPDGSRADPMKGPHFTISPTLLYPKSRGTIRLRSTNVADAPAIDAAYFTKREDLDVMVSGLEAAHEVVRASPLSDIAGEPANAGASATSREEMIAAIRASAVTIFHPVGTCRMGTDEEAVVSPDLRVRGVEALRVADASIMPTIVGGNTNAASMMIGEKAAELIVGA